MSFSGSIQCCNDSFSSSKPASSDRQLFVFLNRDVLVVAGLLAGALANLSVLPRGALDLIKGEDLCTERRVFDPLTIFFSLESLNNVPSTGRRHVSKDVPDIVSWILAVCIGDSRVFLTGTDSLADVNRGFNVDVLVLRELRESVDDVPDIFCCLWTVCVETHSVATSADVCTGLRVNIVLGELSGTVPREG